nr:metallopeptidase TldD-related protein [Buchnera aphidicola]
MVFLVKKGKIIHPVSEITISGNLKNIWNNIIVLSDDIQKNCNIYCPSILVENIQISGN